MSCPHIAKIQQPGHCSDWCEQMEAENAKLRAALAEIGCKYPQAVSREEAADMAVEFHSIALEALQSCADSSPEKK